MSSGTMQFIWEGLTNLEIELPPLRQGKGGCGFTSVARGMEYTFKVAYAKCGIRLPNVPILDHQKWESKVRQTSPAKKGWWPEHLLLKALWSAYCVPIQYSGTALYHRLHEVRSFPASLKDEIKRVLSRGIALSAVMKITENCAPYNRRPYVINRDDERLNKHMTYGKDRLWNHAIVLVGSLDVVTKEDEAKYGVDAGLYWLFQDSVGSGADRTKSSGWFRNAINIVDPDLLIGKVCYGVSYPANVFIRQPLDVSRVAGFYLRMQQQNQQFRQSAALSNSQDDVAAFSSDQELRERHEKAYLEWEHEHLKGQKDSVSLRSGMNCIWDHFPDYKILLPPIKHGPDQDSCNFCSIVRHQEYNLLIAYAKLGIQLGNVPVLDHITWEAEVRGADENLQGRWLAFELMSKAYGGDLVDDEDGRPKRPIPYSETHLPHWINEKHTISAKSIREILWLLSQGISLVAVIGVTQSYTNQKPYVICGDEKLDKPIRDEMGRLVTRAVVIVGSFEAGPDEVNKYGIAAGTYLLCQESFGEDADDTTSFLANGMNIIQPDLVIVLYYGVSYPASLFYRERTVEVHKISKHEDDLLRRRQLEKATMNEDPRN